MANKVSSKAPAEKTKNTPATTTQNKNMVYALGGIIGLALLVAVGFIVLNASSTIGFDAGKFADIPQSRGADGAFQLGNPDAPIKIIEFADFLCPACQSFKPEINTLIENEVAEGRALFEYRMVITAGGETMRYAGQMAECAEILQPGSFWVAYENLFDMGVKNQLTLNSSDIFAQRMGLNQGELISCTRTADQIQTDIRYASSLGVDSTPQVWIQVGDSRPQPLPGPRTYEGIKAVIDTFATLQQ